MHLTVQIQIPLVGQLHAALPHIAGCVPLRCHALEPALHHAGHDQCRDQANDQRHAQIHDRERLLGHVVHIVGVAFAGGGDICVRPLDKGAEGGGVITVCHIGGHLLAKVLDAGIRKGGNAVAAGGDMPFAVAYAHQQQHAVPVFTVAELAVIIQVIGIFLHAGAALAFQRVDGGNDYIKALADAQFLQRSFQLAVLVLGQDFCAVVHAVVQVGKAVCGKGRYSQRQQNHQCGQRSTEGAQSGSSVFHLPSLLYRIPASHSSHITA